MELLLGSSSMKWPRGDGPAPPCLRLGPSGLPRFSYAPHHPRPGLSQLGCSGTRSRVFPEESICRLSSNNC